VKRNIKVTLILLILVMTFTYPVSSLEVTQNEAVKDLDYLFNRIEEVHPNIYFHQSREETQKRF